MCTVITVPVMLTHVMTSQSLVMAAIQVQLNTCTQQREHIKINCINFPLIRINYLQ